MYKLYQKGLSKTQFDNAIQTRKQELIEERIAYIERTQARNRLKESEKRLSQNIYERGVDDEGRQEYDHEETKLYLGASHPVPTIHMVVTI